MSCEKNANKISSANLSAGITRTVSKSAYVRALKRNAERTRAMLKSIRRFLAGTPSETSAVTELKPSERIAPITPPAGKTCADCGASAAKPGTWYRLNGEVYCADCAPKAAKEAGVTLAIPAASTASSSGFSASSKPVGTSRLAPDAIRLKEEAVDIVISDANNAPRMIRMDKAFTVWHAKRPTGIAITPTPGTDGQWTLTHLDTGRAFADGFRDIHEAEGLATLLAAFDWNRPFETMPQAQIKAAGKTIGQYQAQLETLRGKLTDRAWRTTDLNGQLIDDGLGDLAYVIEDNGEKLLLAGKDGNYTMPRNIVQPATPAQFKALALAQPVETKHLPANTPCTQCGQSVAKSFDDRWVKVAGKHYCATCAPEQAKKAKLTMPDSYIETLLQKS